MTDDIKQILTGSPPVTTTETQDPLKPPLHDIAGSMGYQWLPALMAGRFPTYPRQIDPGLSPTMQAAMQMGQARGTSPTPYVLGQASGGLGGMMGGAGDVGGMANQLLQPFNNPMSSNNPLASQSPAQNYFKQPQPAQASPYPGSYGPPGFGNVPPAQAPRQPQMMGGPQQGGLAQAMQQIMTTQGQQGGPQQQPPGMGGMTTGGSQAGLAGSRAGMMNQSPAPGSWGTPGSNYEQQLYNQASSEASRQTMPGMPQQQQLGTLPANQPPPVAAPPPQPAGPQQNPLAALQSWFQSMAGQQQAAPPPAAAPQQRAPRQQRAGGQQQGALGAGGKPGWREQRRRGREWRIEKGLPARNLERRAAHTRPDGTIIRQAGSPQEGSQLTPGAGSWAGAKQSWAKGPAEQAAWAAANPGMGAPPPMMPPDPQPFSPGPHTGAPPGMPSQQQPPPPAQTTDRQAGPLPGGWMGPDSGPGGWMSTTERNRQAGGHMGPYGWVPFEEPTGERAGMMGRPQQPPPMQPPVQQPPPPAMTMGSGQAGLQNARAGMGVQQAPMGGQGILPGEMPGLPQGPAPTPEQQAARDAAMNGIPPPPGLPGQQIPMPPGGFQGPIGQLQTPGQPMQPLQPMQMGAMQPPGGGQAGLQAARAGMGPQQMPPQMLGGPQQQGGTGPQPSQGFPQPPYQLPQGQTPQTGPASVYDVYRSSVAPMEAQLQQQIGGAMAQAGMGGNRFSTSAQNNAARLASEASSGLNRDFMSMLYNQGQSDLDRQLSAAGMQIGAGQQDQARRLQAMGMAPQLAQTYDQMDQSRLGDMFNMARYEQDRADRLQQMPYQDYLQSRLGYNPQLLSLLGSIGGQGATPVPPIQTTTGATPGLLDYASQVPWQAIFAGSDERLKDNIEEIPDAVEKMKALRGVTWNWKADGEPSAGVVAQDVEKVLPEAVIEIEGVKHVNYTAVTGLLVEAVNQLIEQRA